MKFEHNRFTRRKLLGAGALAGLALTACGPGVNQENGTGGPAATGAARAGEEEQGGAPPAALREPPPGAVAIVVMTPYVRFEPPSLNIRQGQTVVWTNNSNMIHTVTADPRIAAIPEDVALPPGAGPFDSGNIEPGQSYSRQFTVPGTYRYFCIPHEANGMLGQISVRPAE